MMEDYALLMLRGARESGMHRIEYVERCEGAGHDPFLGQVEWLVGCVRRADGEGVP